MLKRKLLQKKQDKTFVRFIDKEKKSRGLYIYKRNDKKELQKIKKYATKYQLDVLAYSNTISLSKEQYKKYYRGLDVSINKVNVYEMDTLFIDIDIPLYDNYYQLKDALKNSGINNYEVYESASGNIHLYIKTKKFQDKEQYKTVISTVGNYLSRYNLKIDKSSQNPIQKTFLEGFRVLSKRGFSSRYIRELSKSGSEQTPFQILQQMHQRGVKIEKEYSMKYGMHIIQNELLKNYSGELHLSELHQRYLIPKYTLSRALRVLQDFKAIHYKSIRGASGYIQVTYYNENKFNSCIEQQMTRKQNYFYINTIYPVVRCLIRLYRYLIFECCKYIEKSIGAFSDFLGICIQNGYVQGLLSGSSGVQEKNQVQKIPEKQIQEGERNKTLYQTLVKARYRGLEGNELDVLAREIHNKMQQPSNKQFTKTEVQGVLKWVKKIPLYSR
jgi:hypothetical protein